MSGISEEKLFASWIKDLAVWMERPNFRDQTVASMKNLAMLARFYAPSVIVELGVGNGLSLRTWVHAAPETKIVGIDKDFKWLLESLKVVPLKVPNLYLVGMVNFDIYDLLSPSSYWTEEDRVLLYIDVHGDKLMRHLLEYWIPKLPEGSCVCIDDLWWCDVEIRPYNLAEQYNRLVLPEVDPERAGPTFVADYWYGGSFFGFAEVVPLMEWVNEKKMRFSFLPGVKAVWFEC